MDKLLELLILGIDLYFQYKEKNYEFDTKTENELKSKLLKLNEELYKLEDLEEKKV